MAWIASICWTNRQNLATTHKRTYPISEIHRSVFVISVLFLRHIWSHKCLNTQQVPTMNILFFCFLNICRLKCNSSLNLTYLQTVNSLLLTSVLSSLCKKGVYTYIFSGRSSLAMWSASLCQLVQLQRRGGTTNTGWAIEVYGRRHVSRLY